ncbi:MAG: tetratricopeptide repeat protein [Bacteroidia bacterium]|nr:tetratricopeptide repeat protein [Bacteroidia bacterium]
MRNKIHFFYAIVLVCIWQSAMAQSNLDSLKNELSVAVSDSTRVRILIKLSAGYQFENIDQAQTYAADAHAISEKNNWNWALKESNNRIASLAYIMGDFTTALKYYNRYLQSAFSLNDSVSMAKALNNIGQTYTDLGEYDDAYSFLTRGYKLARTINDSLLQAICLQNIGHVFKELGQYDIALNHFIFSAQLSLKIGDLDGEAYIADEIGSLFVSKKDFKNAEENLLKALRVIRERNLLIIEPLTLTKFAELRLEQKQFDIALAYYDSAYQLFADSKNVFGVASTKLGKGKVLAQQQNYSESQKLIGEALSTAKLLNARILEIECYEQLSLLAEQTDDSKKSLEYYKSFKATRDSLYNQEFVEKLFQNLSSETEQKDSEIAQLSLSRSIQQAEIKRQGLIRNILAASAALTGILLFSVYRSSQRRKSLNKLLIEHQAEIKKRSLELQQLNEVKDKFFSIISHDLRSPINALTGILDLVDKDQIKPEEFAQLVKELKVQFNHTKSLINNLLDWALLQMDKLKIQPEKINVQQLVDENFKMLSSIHLKKIEMINRLPEYLFAFADLNTISLVFRNLILNSIKFTDSGGKIWVEATENENELTISVSDNGVGIDTEAQSILFNKTAGYTTRGTANEKGTGLGLILCKEFVERNGGKIWLKSQIGKGSTFYFTLKKG